MWKLIYYEKKEFCFNNCCFGGLCEKKGSDFIKHHLIDNKKLMNLYLRCGTHNNYYISYTPIKNLKSKRF